MPKPLSTDFHILFFLIGAFWFYRAIRSCLALQQIPFLAPLTETAMRPWVSVVMLVRNARAQVERSVRELLAQRQVELELIVVDDRSDDGTSDVLDPMAAADSRLKIERIRELPDGWLPRAHGFSVGSASAAGEWLLLLDQPARIAEDSIARAVQFARVEGVAHLALIPRVRPSALLAPLVISSLMDSLPSIAAANRDRPALPWISPCTLLRADAYRSVGGYDSLRMTPMSELMLAERVRQSGFRLRTQQAADEVLFPTRLESDAMSETLERVIAASGFHLVLLSLALAVYSLLWLAGVYGPFSDNVWGLWAAGGLASQAVPGVLLARIYRLNVGAGLLVPWTLPIELVLSGWVMLRIHLRRGVRWQGRFFSIETLRAAARDDSES